MSLVGRKDTSIEGSLYELVARGAKDTYFIEDDKESTNVYNWQYQRYPATLPEIRWTHPLNPPKFGQRCEFEMDLPGDVLLEASLVIELPSWLPPEFIVNNSKILTYVAGSPNTYYGYTSGIAYFLFEKIEIYQDKILLQEVTGDSLYVASLSKGSWNQAFLTQKIAGVHDGSDISIMRNATPGTLEIPLPMIGCSFPGDKGLPICGLRSQSFRIRLTLRPIEKLIETSTGEVLPNPFEKMFTQGTQVAKAIPRELMKQPTITLRTKQIYLLNGARDQLAKETIEIPYIRYFENPFSINQLEYAPFDNGSAPQIKRVLDASYTVERILIAFRNTQTILKNKLWNFTNSTSTDLQFYTDLDINIAGQLREGSWTPDIYSILTPFAKEERALSQPITIMNWTRGWRIDDVPPAIREPTGGINFTTADRPTLSFTLQNVEKNTILNYKQVHFFATCESWALYKIVKGRGQLAYAN